MPTYSALARTFPSGPPPRAAGRSFQAPCRARIRLQPETARLTGGIVRPVPEFQQVNDSLFVWQGYDPACKTGVSSSALRGPEGLVVVDPVELAAEAVGELLGFGRPRAVVCTSGNHARAAGAWRDRFEIPLFAHRDARSDLGLDADTWLEAGGVTLAGLDLEVVELTGAASGEIALWDARTGGTLVVGDALIHLEPDGLSLLPAKYCSSQKVLRRSLLELTALRFEVMAFAHGQPIVGDARTRVAALLGEG